MGQTFNYCNNNHDNGYDCGLSNFSLNTVIFRTDGSLYMHIQQRGSDDNTASVPRTEEIDPPQLCGNVNDAEDKI